MNANFSATRSPAIRHLPAGRFRRTQMAFIPLQPRSSPGASRRHDALDALSDAAQSVIETARLWRKRSRERSQLAKLGRMLRDIGLAAADREFLVNKPFWRE